MWCSECFLGNLNKIENDIGDIVETVIYSDYIFCNEKSVKSSEFYQAHSVGLKPEVVLEIKLADYNKEKFIKYENEEYTVLRTYKTSTENIELTLTRGVNVST